MKRPIKIISGLVLVGVVIAVIAGASGGTNSTPVPSTGGGTTISAPKSNQTTSEGQAVISAKQYVSTLGTFSESGLIKQLEFGGFSVADATYGADNSGANWTTEAQNDAAQYMSTIGGFSAASLTTQLEFDGFTPSQAAAGVASVGL